MQGWCIEHSEGGCRWRTLWGNTAFPQGVMLELSCGKTEPGGSFHPVPWGVNASCWNVPRVPALCWYTRIAVQPDHPWSAGSVSCKGCVSWNGFKPMNGYMLPSLSWKRSARAELLCLQHSERPIAAPGQCSQGCLQQDVALSLLSLPSPPAPELPC